MDGVGRATTQLQNSTIGNHHSRMRLMANLLVAAKAAGVPSGRLMAERRTTLPLQSAGAACAIDFTSAGSMLHSRSLRLWAASCESSSVIWVQLSISAVGCVGQLALALVALRRTTQSNLALPFALLFLDIFGWNLASLVQDLPDWISRTSRCGAGWTTPPRR